MTSPRATIATLAGINRVPDARAPMQTIVYLEYPNGGTVFSVSSTCWLGALEVEN